MSLAVSHFSGSDATGGASGAAIRIHWGLLKLGVRSKLWVAHRENRIPDVALLRHNSFVRRRWRSIEQYFDGRMLSSAQVGATDTVSTSFFGHDPLPSIKMDAADIVQLHWIGGMVLSLSKLKHIKQPIVWRLPDMWAFCGVEHYTMDSQRFRDGYTQTNRSPDEIGIDISRWVWKHKKQIYNKIKRLTIVCPSQWLACCARESAILYDREIVVIKTGCDTETFRPLERIMCRRLLGLPADIPLVLIGAAGLQSRRKGIDLFVKAVTSLHNDATCPDFAVAVVGMGNKDLHSGLSVAVHEMGFIQDSLHMSLLYNAADVFVAPSRQENLANTVLESLACGTPCVAFNIGGMPDAIDHKINGWLAVPYSTEELATGIRWLLTHPQPEALRNASRKKWRLTSHWTRRRDSFLASTKGSANKDPETAPSYDVIVLPFSFRPELRQMSEFNIATKMSECLASGTVTLVVGPENAAMMRFLAEYRAACLTTASKLGGLQVAIENLKNEGYGRRILNSASERVHSELSTTIMCGIWQAATANLAVGSAQAL